MSGAPEVRRRGLVRSPYDLAGGLFLLALAVLGFAGGFGLPTGSPSSIGSGMVPKAVAVMVGVLGVALMVVAFLTEGDQLERWHLRGPVFVLGGVIVFAMLIRGSTLDFGVGSVTIPPLGLIVAGPLVVIISSLGSSETRPKEIAVFSVVLTLAAGLLFKEMLSLPIPYDPAGLIPEPLNAAYEATKSALGTVFAFIVSLITR